jgi:tRNA 2-thiocytidine biosynthesis protein TtcA
VSVVQEIVSDIPSLDQKINRAIGKAIARFDMIHEGDKLLVAVSGGKDSLAMLHYLKQFRKKAPVSFEYIAVNVDQKQPGFDEQHMPNLFESWEVPYEIVEQDTYSVVLDKTPAGKSYCSVCSRLRRGILYETAKKLGCNKVALGHHMDDVMETFLLNMFFSGKLAAMPARYQTDKEGN